MKREHLGAAASTIGLVGCPCWQHGVAFTVGKFLTVIYCSVGRMPQLFRVRNLWLLSNLCVTVSQSMHAAQVSEPCSLWPRRTQSPARGRLPATRGRHSRRRNPSGHYIDRARNERTGTYLLLTPGNLLNETLEIMSMAYDKLEPPGFYWTTRCFDHNFI